MTLKYSDGVVFFQTDPMGFAAIVILVATLILVAGLAGYAIGVKSGYRTLRREMQQASLSAPGDSSD